MTQPHTITVQFFRTAEDDEMAEKQFPMLPLAKARRAQLRAELQEAYDEGILAGGFTVQEEP